MFTDLSTQCFLTAPNDEEHHKQMGYSPPPTTLDTFEKRIEHMLDACGMDRAQFARTLAGAGQQKLTNWIARGRIGSQSRREVSELTGVSTDWLNDGIGVPFPEGPRKPGFIKEIRGTYGEAGATMALSPRERALIENYRASDERFRKVVDDQVAASAESGLKDGAG